MRPSKTVKAPSVSRLDTLMVRSAPRTWTGRPSPLAVIRAALVEAGICKLPPMIYARGRRESAHGQRRFGIIVPMTARKRILFLAEGATMAHFVRPLALAQ